MNRPVGCWTAVMALIAALALAGCGKEEKTIVQQVPVPVPAEIPQDTGGFPGTTVQANNLADDGHAFSPNGQDVDPNSLYVAWDVRGRAIVMFTTTNLVGGEVNLFASFFDGTGFTPPVELQGLRQDAAAVPTAVGVLFLNTAGSADSNAAARDGDALILFLRNDVAPPATIDEQAATRLYGTYFDRSETGTAGTGTVRYGFETVAMPVDYNHVFLGGTDPGVASAGFVSDSLHGTHQFGVTANPMDSGDPTTFVHIVWNKPQSNGSTAITNRLQFATFDLTQVGNALPVQATATENTLSPGAGVLESFNSVETGFLVHNGHLLWRVSPGLLGDLVVTDSVFDGAGATAINLGSDPTANVDTTVMPDAGNVYGGDQGLTSLYAFFTESGFTDGTDGSRAADVDLMLAKVDDGATTREIAEIDAFTGVTDYTDGDSDGLIVRDGTRGSVTGLVETRIDRTGQYIVALWTQESTDLTDADDASLPIGQALQNLLPYARAVQTRRDSTPRALGASYSAVVTSPSLVATGDVGTGQAQDDVGALNFQSELAQGRSLTNGGTTVPMPACGMQSDHLRMNWTYEQLVDQSLPLPNDTRLLTNGVAVTLDATGAAPPAIALASASEAVVQPGLDPSYGISFDAVSTDGGSAPGDVLVYYFANGNNPTDPTTIFAFTERRLYVWDGTTGTVSTMGSDAEDQAAGTATIYTVPANSDAALYPDWGGTTTHVLWGEVDGTLGSPLLLAARSVDKAAAGTLSLRHVPALTDLPSRIDSLTAGDLGPLLGTLRSGNTLGVYYGEGGHFRYQETATDAVGYLATPALIDTVSPMDVANATVLVPPTCDSLSASIAAFFKDEGAGGASERRLFLRVHN